MKNVKNRDMDLVATEKIRNYLVSELNYHTTKFFTSTFLAIEIKRAQILINKLFYLGLSILEISKIVICKFWYDYVKP